MANRVRLRFSGLNELRRAIHLYGEAVVRAAVDEVTDAVEDTVLKARFLAPVDDGDLRDSIRGSVKVDAHGAVGVVRATARHAHLVEFGTARIAKRPHLVPAAIGNRRRMNERLARVIEDKAPEGLGTPRLSGEGPATPGIAIE